ncbi:MAG: hypothetical protein ACTSXT_01430 [Candidatus Helarchaeota archaeon]
MNDLTLNRNKIESIEYNSNKDIISYLEKIAEYYKQKYNLNTFIDICWQGDDAYFTYKENFIFIALDYAIKLYIRGKYKNRAYINNLKEAYIFTLLHEIHHAIKHKEDFNFWDNTFQKVNIGLYKNDIDYHNSLFFEKQADEFANIEINRWL